MSHRTYFFLSDVILSRDFKIFRCPTSDFHNPFDSVRRAVSASRRGLLSERIDVFGGKWHAVRCVHVLVGLTPAFRRGVMKQVTDTKTGIGKFCLNFPFYPLTSGILVGDEFLLLKFNQGQNFEIRKLGEVSVAKFSGSGA